MSHYCENVIGDCLETNNSGDMSSGPGKAGRSRFSWMKALLSWAEVFKLFLAFGQWLNLGKMENMLTLCCIGNTLVLFCFVPLLKKINFFVLKRLV